MLNAYAVKTSRAPAPQTIPEFIDQMVEIHLQMERLWYPSFKHELTTRLSLDNQIAYEYSIVNFRSKKLS